YRPTRKPLKGGDNVGTRGPIGKRTDQLRGHGAASAREDAGVERPKADDLHWPKPLDHWHPLVIEWYESLQKPAIACFLQQTDGAQARLVAQRITDQMGGSGRVSAAALAARLSAMDSLVTSEGARRRLRIEVGRRDEREAAPVLDIVDRRNKLASSE